MGRILVIRGGAIGDFILTLPAIRLLRENFPDSHLEILGYRHIAALAEGRYYARATRSIEYAPLSRFFHPSAPLDADLCEYFASFHQVVSYIYDPDLLFEGGLRRAGVKNLITSSPVLGEGEHAAYQLARPLEQLALWLDSPAAEIFPSESDRIQAAAMVGSLPRPLLAIHPGSGGKKKNWPIENWLELRRHFSNRYSEGHVVIITGESDAAELAILRKNSAGSKETFLENLPLPLLGAILSQCNLFVGHDSGISHLAAASGAPSLLLFGPSNPEVWAPANENVRILKAPDGDLSQLEVQNVVQTLDSILIDVR